MTLGRVHSIQSLGTVDGPGVRFVAFLQGCPLRCKCCHNPDTWSFAGGTEYTPERLVEKALRYREYFGREGGVTLSGGEPLMQAEFCREVFALCRENGLNTCLDTSGVRLDESVGRLLEVTDRVLLDLKYTDPAQYREHVGMELSAALEFLRELDRRHIPVTLRQVIVPTVNDGEDSLLRLREIGAAHPCVEKTELLPFRKICQSKYDSMGLAFPFGHLPTPTAGDMERLNRLLGGGT